MIWLSADLSSTKRCRKAVVRLNVFGVFLVAMTILNVSLAADQTTADVDHDVPHFMRKGLDRATAQYVDEASKRFLIPSSWIWAVMKVESAGDVRALSNKGAMGLMQIMPRTWETLRQQHALGSDPYNPRDNILAGAAYLRELYDRYGERGFFAAYNAGPARYEEHLTGQHGLPAETVDYVLKLTSLLDPAWQVRGLYSAEKQPSVNTSALFPAPRTDPDDASLQNENHPSDRSESVQRIVDHSAFTPMSAGLFIRLLR